MTAKEFLKQYEEAQRRALRYKTEYEKEMELIDAVGSTLGGEPGMPRGSGVSRSTEAKALRLADKALKWKQAELDAIDKRQEVFDVICTVKDLPGEVLYERYVNLHKWEEICVLVHKSWNSVHYAHRKALRIVQEYLDTLV